MEINEWGLSMDYKNKPVGDDKRGPQLWKQEMTRGNLCCGSKR